MPLAELGAWCDQARPNVTKRTCSVSPGAKTSLFLYSILMENGNSSSLDGLLVRIGNKTARVGIIGLGYVGLPLGVVFAEAGFEVIGIDIKQNVVDNLNQGRSHVEDIPDSWLKPLVNSGKFRATTDYSQLAHCDGVSICVPTPLHKIWRPGHLVYHLGYRTDRAARSRGNGHRARKHDVSGHDIGDYPSGACRERSPGRRGLLPMLLAGARGSR